MTRAAQSCHVANERQDEPLAIARAGDYLGTEEGRNRQAGVSSLSHDATAVDAGLPTVCRALAEAPRIEHVEDHIRRVVDAAPPLTAEQRDKLTLLLRGATSNSPTPPPASTAT